MPIQTLKKFIRYEASAGIILFIAAVLALIVDNTSLSPYYQDLLTFRVHLPLGLISIEKPLLMWINDGFMAVFFLLVGLEMKREMIIGELKSPKDRVLPVVAAIGGMLLPALVYLALTHSSPQLVRGWAIPTATDIAFALGILTLLVRHIPPSLKIFLTAMAIFDDLGAIIIIALFYTASLSMYMLLGAAIAILLLIALNMSGVQKSWPYILVGFILWICVLKSGVHATLAGIIVALAIPVEKQKGGGLDLLERWEQGLHPWVAYFILPVFAFANAGIRFSGMEVSSLWSGVTLACALGLFIGKQVGITGATWLAVKLKWTKLSQSMNMRSVWAISLIAGVGFTMSLFIGSLAFSSAGVDMMARVRLGIIVGSLASGVCGYICLKKIYDK